MYTWKEYVIEPDGFPKEPHLILATDLDGTFLGGDEAARSKLYRQLREQADQTLLIFVTGRDLDFIADLVKQPKMPRPDLIIGDVGTTVVTGPGVNGEPGFEPLAAVQEWIDGRWDDANDRVREMLDGVAGIELQPVMGRRRVSYFYDPVEFDPASVSHVAAAGFDVITSADLYLDVLPKGVAKGPTLMRLVDALDLHRDRVLTAGDTLNDLSLFQTPFHGVAVGNSEPRLVAELDELPDVYRARGEGCAGISEAIEHFGLTDPARTSA